MNKTESIFSSLLASSLLVGLPSVLFVFIVVYFSFGIFRKRFSNKDTFPPIVGVYITKCIYSITYYWEKIIPQLKFVRINHDFIVFQCISIVLTLKLIDFLQEGSKTVRELSNLTNISEKHLQKVMNILTMEGFFSFSEPTGKYSFNKAIKPSPSYRICNNNSNNSINNICSNNGADIKTRTSSGLSTSPLSTSISSNGMKTYLESKNSFFLDEFDDEWNEFTFDLCGNTQEDGSNNSIQSVSSLLSILSYPNFIESWQKLRECVQSSVPGFQIKHGVAFFQYIDEREIYLKKIFECSMKQKNLLLKANQHVSNLYNFSAYPNIVDICGGFGFLGFEILKRHPDTKITVLELEETVKSGIELSTFDKTKKNYLQTEQIIFKVGDMFQPSLIPNANLYILMQVIHDWNNQDAIRILSSIASVMRKEKANNNNITPKLLIIDSIVEENFYNSENQSSCGSSNSSSCGSSNSTSCGSINNKNNNNNTFNKSLFISDIVMMAIVGGEERTKKQWENLFKESNLFLMQIIKFNLPPYLSIMELTIE